MPRRRTTRNTTKRPGPTMPAGDEGATIDAECRKEKVKTLIQDFENEVKSKLSALDVMKHNLFRQIDLAYTVELLQIPPEIRNMKLTDYLKNGGSFEVKESTVTSEVDSISGKSDASANQLQTVEEDENVPTTTTGTTRQGRQRRKKASGAPTTTVRRGRSRQQTGDITVETPAFRTRANMPMMTPLITPKFDPRLYQTAAVTKRMAKPHEVLVSMEGSPVLNSYESKTFVLPVNKSKITKIGRAHV